MTQVFPFVPNVQAPFTFQPTMDGQGYAVSVTWNVFGQRWYVNMNQLTGPLVFSLPLIGSPDGTSIESISWAFGVVTVVAADPHRYTIGQTIPITIYGASPAGYNGTFDALIVDEVTFTFQLATDPGAATAFGQQIYDIDIAGGYFETSKLVYRESSKTFEATP